MKIHLGRGWAILFTTMVSALVTQAGFACSADAAMTQLRNATYTGIEDEPVTLADGSWEGPPYVEGGLSRPRIGLLEDFCFSGDLDADGDKETVVILWQSAGGTGSNIFLAVMQSDDGRFENLSTALIGDRVKLRSGKIDTGKISIDVLQVGENDPMCCPTMLATRTWLLQDTQLEEGDMEVTGILSLDAMEGSEWLLTHLNRERPVPEDTVVTLTFGTGRISGKSACNRYSANIRDGDNPGDILIGESMGTRMACPDHLMEIEHLYLEALQQVTSFSFHSGSLVFDGQDTDGTTFSMLFTPAGIRQQ